MREHKKHHKPLAYLPTAFMLALVMQVSLPAQIIENADSTTPVSQVSNTAEQPEHTGATVEKATTIVTVVELREESKRLIQESRKLEDMARQTERDADRAEDQAEDLEELAEETRDAQLRAQADSLSIAARTLAKKATVMETMAEEREARAEDLEDKADSLEEALDPRPLWKRRPFRVSIEHRVSAVEEETAGNYYALLNGGLTLDYQATRHLDFGIHDLSFRTHETLYGSRSALGFAPTVGFVLFAPGRLQLKAAAGLTIQAQFGAGRTGTTALAPFLAGYADLRINKLFSLGPVFQVNYVSKGKYLVRAIMPNHAKVIPDRGLWSEGGLAFSFHF